MPEAKEKIVYSKAVSIILNYSPENNNWAESQDLCLISEISLPC